MIISASRRTDIPAFYTPWFINRIREEFLLTRNPFNANQIKRVSLKPNDVEVIVFWTRNPSKLMQHLPMLDELGHKYYFQYTITGYPRTIEAATPKPRRAIQTFLELSEMIGPDKVVWRYDPILLSNLLPIEEHKRLFSKIAAKLAGKTNRVVISFSDFYKKTERNLNKVEGLEYCDITEDRDQLLELSRYMADVAAEYDFEIKSCAEAVDTSSAGIKHGKCIDEELIKEVFGIQLSSEKDKGQRDECGCIKSIDIGMYNTCIHECSYCYATFSKNTIVNNKRKHDVNSPFLVGGVEGVDPDLLAGNDVQASLF
jgi:DNA repair photolyase